MGVGVQREGRIGVSQNAGQRFGVHAAGEGMGCEGMAQIVEADAGEFCPLEHCLHVAILGRVVPPLCLAAATQRHTGPSKR